MACALEDTSAREADVKQEAPYLEKRVDALTQRERQVAILIARGLTNRRIGAELVISRRTADTHVANILSKLSVTSRAQVAALVVAEGLLLPPNR